MQLSGEDLLRLNVMMAQDVRAVRIDENRMQVFGLTGDGEARVDLNPGCRDEQYIKLVREFLSGHVFGSPGGYPVFISRWTRMGQASDENLQQLLMLGEPEAVMAVVHAKGLTPDIAHCAWWCMPESENARRMLEKQVIVESDLGPVLAEHLFEHLAFETEPRPIIDSVRLMLQPGLIDEEKQAKLWRTSQRKNVYLVGFLQSVLDVMPHDKPAHEFYEKVVQQLSGMQGNRYVDMLLLLLSGEGQGYLHTAYTVLQKPANQDVVVYLLNTLQEKLSPALPVPMRDWPREIELIDNFATALLDPASDDFAHADEAWKVMVKETSDDHDVRQLLESMAWLAQLSEAVVADIFAQTTAEGT
ncbi:MAG: sulfur reduction protein DsrS, partial [Gammaproteobacteria bacterium]|nr:sulfur reduction protein DsrS [Gammaproteobacteria bacterium]